MKGFCSDCNTDRDLVCMIPYCDYMPNGLKREIPNHPKFDDGRIDCSDFAEDMPNQCTPCMPSETEWDEVTPLDQYSDYYFRCSECDSLNVEKKQ